jgi:hypothetical protein
VHDEASSRRISITVYTVTMASRKFRITIWTAIVFVLLLVVAFGILRSQCPSAADRANAIRMEDIERSAKSYERAKRLSQLGHQLEAAPPSDRDAIIDSIINEFDAATQARIRALATRGERLDAIRVEIKKDNETSIAKTEAMQPHFWCR